MAETYNPQFIGTFVNDTSAVGAVNNNFAAISAAFEDTLSRSGSLPNQMQATLDMNSNQIINLPAPLTTTSPLRLADVGTFPAGSFTPASTGTAGHVVPFLDGNNTWTGNQILNFTPNWSVSTQEPVQINATTSGSTPNTTTVFAVNVTDNSSNGTGGNFGFGIGSFFTTGGSSTQGDKSAVIGGVVVNAPPAGGFSPFYTGVIGLSTAEVNLGGSSTSTLGLSAGQIYGTLGWGQTTSASTNLSHVTGLVGFVTINSSASLWAKSACLLQATSADVTSGSSVDTLLWMNTQSGATARFKNAILIDNYGGNGGFPVATTGQVIKVGPGTVATGLDFSTMTFTTGAILSPGFTVGPQGAITTGSNALGVNGSITFNGSSSSNCNISVNSTSTLLTHSCAVQVGIIGQTGTGAITLAGGTSGSTTISCTNTGSGVVLGGNNFLINSTGAFSSAGLFGVIADVTATPAGGQASTGLFFGTSLVGIYFGSGAPTVSAPQGSLYIRTDGSSTSTRLYVNTNGSTTWTNFTSAT